MGKATDKASLRRQRVLHAVVHLHVATGRPSGSTAVAEHLRGRWSAATVRSEVAALAEAGLLDRSHASAGSVPTWAGYRAYADDLLEAYREHRGARYAARGADAVPERLPGTDAAAPGAMAIPHDDADPAVFLRHLGLWLADRARCVVVANTPPVERTRVAHLEFIQLGPRRVLAVIVAHTGDVVHRHLELDDPVTAPELAALNATARARFVGASLLEIRTRVRLELGDAQRRADTIIRKALLLAEQAVAGRGAGELLIEGKEQLFGLPDFEDLSTLRPVLEAMERKEAWLRLLDRSLEVEGVVVEVGDELRPFGLADCTLITAPYGIVDAGRRTHLGRVGIVGPMRMDYGRLIPLVVATAARVSEQLSRGPLWAPGDESSAWTSAPDPRAGAVT